MNTYSRLATNIKNLIKKTPWLLEDYREPVKEDFAGAKYRVIEYPWNKETDTRGRVIYKGLPIPTHAIERFSPKYGWQIVTAQILPYYYEQMAFLSKERAESYKVKLEDPQSPYFDGMVNYEDQDKARFDLTFFPKD